MPIPTPRALAVGVCAYADGNPTPTAVTHSPTRVYADGETPTVAVGERRRRGELGLRRRGRAVGVCVESRSVSLMGVAS